MKETAGGRRNGRLASRVLVVGLTGGIAAGKSTVAGFLREWGAVVLDADQVARDPVWEAFSFDDIDGYLEQYAEDRRGEIAATYDAYPEAEALLLSNSDSFFSPEAEMSPQERGLAVGHIVKHYENWGKPSEAAKWKAKLNALAQTQLNAKVQ